MMPNITVTCGEIQTDGGFEFKLPSDSLNQTLNPDCEQSWYLQSHFSREIMFRVRNQTAATPNSDVVNEASLQHSGYRRWQHSGGDPEESWESMSYDLKAHFSHVTAYRVRNQTAVTPNSDLQQVTPDLQHSDHFWWLLAVFIIALLIIILICLMKRKRIFRCFQRLIFQRDDDDSENRDPEAAVQMKLRSDAPDSLNQSDSEQLNGSLSRG
ncbi:hypothetical protein ROHU_016244 [Labeo rohita]|uniref:Uncharacterized protein n=1 Tax=Labeo rohita TaxID=84645 RepID=A0A498NKW5_LABRO|nr:hypothetical protein ROHU_016244 [Labeo rohita]